MWLSTSLLQYRKLFIDTNRCGASYACDYILFSEPHTSFLVHSGPAQCNYSIHSENERESKGRSFHDKDIHADRFTIVQVKIHDAHALAKVLLTTHCKDTNDLMLPGTAAGHVSDAS
ncbi:hypothetical protein E2C01_023656 [Portunus trituberculatus]|uniref:Uncharacterized protein n=1 Tax=Portunus trituberculatus TaxID=210409 RepID=A0A5B7EBP5_PORTR|nr:hypothetical protein [Portunus trituberculatus]